MGAPEAVRRARHRACRNEGGRHDHAAQVLGEHPDVKADKIIAPFSQCLPYAQEPDGDLRQTGKWARVNELLQNAFDATVYKKVPATESLKRFTEEANAVLAQK